MNEKSNDEPTSELSAIENNTSTSSLSRNALKRQRKTLIWQQKRKEMKERKKKIKKEAKVCELVEGKAELDSIQEANRNDIDDETKSMNRKIRKEEEKEQFFKKCDNSYHVIIDCNFENEHNDRALGTLSTSIFYIR
jgi:hypothetical protein